MKFIHTADLHLDSAMKSNLTSEKAKERKSEILHTFVRLVNFAKENEVRAILIAGDLFDTKTVTVKTKNVLVGLIKENPEIDFLYIKGNHDNLTEAFSEPIENLKLFNDSWTTYEYGNVTVTGAELNGNASVYSTLLLDKDKVNIVMLHGQEANYVGPDKTDIVNLPLLKDKFIDYLALGHIHAYKEGVLDKRGTYAYSGCLEGRGYDEAGDKGFVLLEVEGNKVNKTFCPFASRKVEEIKVDIENATTTPEVIERIANTLNGVSERSIVKVRLVGEITLDTEYDLDYIFTRFKDDFYAFKIVDEDVRLKIDIDALKGDVSLKGEFVRVVGSQELSAEEKKAVIELGLKALSGEEF